MNNWSAMTIPDLYFGSFRKIEHSLPEEAPATPPFTDTVHLDPFGR
jgi:hypothetical protein